MKVPSFKKFLEEEDSKAIVQTGLNSKSIDNSVTKEIINSRLANATSNPFLTPYIALGSIARILAYVNIVVPQYTFLDRDEGEVVFDATQVGQIAGVNLDGSPARSEADHFIYFSYSMNDEGYYDCFAALVDSDELEDIMDMGGDEDVDQFDVDQKVNEENVDEAMKWDETSSSSLPAKDQDTIKGHEEAHIWHAKMADAVRDSFQHRQYPNADTRSYIQFHIKRMAHHNVQADHMRRQGMRYEEVEQVNATEELKGNQHKLDVAEPKGKLTSADFKKLRSEAQTMGQRSLAARKGGLTRAINAKKSN